MPVGGSCGPQSQPKWQGALRKYGPPGIACDTLGRARTACFSATYLTGDSNEITSSLASWARSHDFTSHLYCRNILSVRPSSCPLSVTVARVSNPSQTRKTL